MITKKDLVVSILCTFCLTTVILTITPVKSAAEWDPWVDVREDGTINVLDLIKVAGSLGTSGNTTKNVNVTNLPLDSNGNLKVSSMPTEEIVADGFLTTMLRRVDHGYNLHDIPWGIFTNSSEIMLNGQNITVLGGQVSGGSTWSGWTSMSNTAGNSVAGATGSASATGRIEAYNSTNGLICRLSMPLYTKIRVINVYKIVLFVDVVVPVQFTNVQWFETGNSIDAIGTVFWKQS